MKLRKILNGICWFLIALPFIGAALIFYDHKLGLVVMTIGWASWWIVGSFAAKYRDRQKAPKSP